MESLRDYKLWSASDIPYSTFKVGRSMFISIIVYIQMREQIHHGRLGPKMKTIGGYLFFFGFVFCHFSGIVCSHLKTIAYGHFPDIGISDAFLQFF
jgi:hypothetical protein